MQQENIEQRKSNGFFHEARFDKSFMAVKSAIKPVNGSDSRGIFCFPYIQNAGAFTTLVPKRLLVDSKNLTRLLKFSSKKW